jgi:hypothetical protein
MKFSLFFLLFSTVIFNNNTEQDNYLKYSYTSALSSCDSYDYLEISDMPRYEVGEFSERWDPWYQTHYTAFVTFSDGVKGKLFRGGVTKQYFIGDSEGGKFYYASLDATIRAVYLYKKYNCVSGKYRL